MWGHKKPALGGLFIEHAKQLNLSLSWPHKLHDVYRHDFILPVTEDNYLAG